MRTAFIEQLIEEGKINDKIFLIVGDLGFNVVEKFRDVFPDRFINAGIAEQNMVGVAAGLALQGYIVYIYSIANFPTLRCFEQIRYDIAYHNLNVKIVSVGAGYAYGSLGASHHATEDMGVMRAIPNMVICSPSDPVETKIITTISVNYLGPMYLRLGKAGEGVVHKKDGIIFSIGDFVSLKSTHTEVALLATGSILDYAVNFIRENAIETDIYSVPFVKPMNISQLKKIAQSHKKLIIIEEHQKSCGLGSAIVEQLVDLQSNGELQTIPVIIRKAINDKFYYKSGSQNYLRSVAGLELNKELFFC